MNNFLPHGDGGDLLYMSLALQEAAEAAEKEEIPVGAVVVWEGKVVGRGHNQREGLQSPMAHAEILAILVAEGPLPAGGVMHCFSGDRAFADQVLDLGFFISIPGVVTFAKAIELQEAVRHIPLDRLLLETDGPFLAPVPYRGRTNFPQMLPFTAQKVAELKGLSLEEVAAVTTSNACCLFQIEVD